MDQDFTIEKPWIGVRVRPLLASDIGSGCISVSRKEQSLEVTIHSKDPKVEPDTRHFHFGQVTRRDHHRAAAEF